ncbi:gliding motility-associated C-terminal domain-containing protein [Anseongella ginsenosidimutans]|nr:gliding motility-associated C-terminal domain-containing protein [Anseongella ginsenosidimutans]QEC52661.1 DUF11 domain-containing protein [Anseongella ginsenosidimutans]
MPNPICSPVSTPVSVEVMDCMALAVSKTASAAEVSAGDPLTYTINLTNRGPSALQAGQVITLKEALPEGFNIGSVNALGTLDLEAQTWTGIQLQPGESTSITIEGTVAPDYTGDPFVNTVTVIPPEGVKNTSRIDSLDQTTTPIRRTADLVITKKALQSAVKAGQALNYEISITNNGPSRILPTDAFNLLEELPEGYLIRNYEAEEGVFNYLTGDWTEADLEAGETIRLFVYGLVDSRFEGASISNTTGLTPPDAVTDPVLPNTSGVTTPVTKEANLELVKAGPGRMTPNENVWYTVRVTNNGPSYARDVLITDAVPPEVAVESWSTTPGPGTQILSGETGTGNDVEVRANIPVGSDVLIRINGKVIPGSSGEIVNEATAVLPADIPDPTPNTDSHTNMLDGMDQLLLRKRGPSGAVSGGAITYTIQLINNSNVTLSDIQFEDLLQPAEALSGIRWTAVPDDPGVTMSLESGNSLPINLEASIPPDKKITISIRGTIAQDFTGEILNTANAVSGTEISGDEVRTNVYKPAAITIEKSGPAQAEAGAEISYTITVSNTGSGESGDLLISDRLPLGSKYISSDGGTYNKNYHTLFWRHETGLAPGASIEHQVKVQAPADAPEITNIASVAGKSDAFVTEIRPEAGLSISKTAPDSVYQQDNFSYVILARNNGPSTARNITITDAVPAGLEIIDPGGGVVNGQEITWAIPSLPRNGVRRFTVEVKAPSQSATLSNSVSIRAESPDPDNSDNTASAVTRVLPSTDLLVEKTGPAEAYAGEEVSYQLRVSNLGPSAAENVIVTDRLPSGMEYIASDLAPADSLANPLSWTIPRLEPGESSTINVTVKTPGRVGIARNIADVTGPFYDKDPVNNRSIFSTTITPAADVEVIKEGTAAIDSAGIIRYEILIRNNGPSTALNVTFQDQLPTNLGAPLSISNGGVYDPGSHGISWPALPAMAAGTERLLTVRVGVNANASSFTVSNTAAIQSTVFDPQAANNRSVFKTGVYPPADVFFSLSQDRVCKGQMLALSGGGVRNNVPGTGVYSGPGISEGQFNSANLEPGDYEVTYTYTTLGGTVKQLRDTLHLLPAARADAGPDREILEGDSIVLEAGATGEIIRWTPSEGLDNPAIVRAVAAPRVTTTYRLTAENPGTCSAFDEVTVYVYPRLEIPNAFTPNDDGVNDTWKIVNIEEYPNATVQVFNRNGDRLFISRGYAEEWEGEFNNKPVPPGTYYYLVRPNGGILQPLTGSVTIIR